MWWAYSTVAHCSRPLNLLLQTGCHFRPAHNVLQSWSLCIHSPPNKERLPLIRSFGRSHVSASNYVFYHFSLIDILFQIYHHDNTHTLSIPPQQYTYFLYTTTTIHILSVYTTTIHILSVYHHNNTHTFCIPPQQYTYSLYTTTIQILSVSVSSSISGGPVTGWTNCR